MVLAVGWEPGSPAYDLSTSLYMVSDHSVIQLKLLYIVMCFEENKNGRCEPF